MGATVVEEEVDGEVEVVDEEDLLPGFLGPLGGMMKACCPRLLALLCCLSLSDCVWCIVLERNDMQHRRRSNGECVMSGLTIIILTFHSAVHPHKPQDASDNTRRRRTRTLCWWLRLLPAVFC